LLIRVFSAAIHCPDDAGSGVGYPRDGQERHMLLVSRIALVERVDANYQGKRYGFTVLLRDAPLGFGTQRREPARHDIPVIQWKYPTGRSDNADGTTPVVFQNVQTEAVDAGAIQRASPSRSVIDVLRTCFATDVGVYAANRTFLGNGAAACGEHGYKGEASQVRMHPILPMNATDHIERTQDFVDKRHWSTD
jgi:hypothetical protein